VTAVLARLLISTIVVGLAVRSTPAADVPKKVLLVGSPPDSHPVGTHEYLPGMEILGKCLKGVAAVEATVANAEGAWKEGPDLIGRSDCVVLFLTEGAAWVSADAARLAAFRQLARRGGGLICIHWGMGTRDAGPIQAFVALFGGCHGGPDRKYQVVDATVSVADRSHPIASGLKDFKVRDEYYYRLKLDKSVRPILRVPIDGNAETVAWAWERPDGGRSFGFSAMHFHENWKLPEYRRLMTQAVLWTSKLPVPSQGVRVDLADADLRLPPRK
jgi:type 1 glutamine amidotransferase